MSKDIVIIDVDRRWTQQAREDALAGNPPRDAVRPDPRQEEIERFYRELFVKNRAPVLAEAEVVAERVHEARKALAATKQDIVGRERVEQLRKTLGADLQSARPETVKQMKKKLYAFSISRTSGSSTI